MLLKTYQREFLSIFDKNKMTVTFAFTNCRSLAGNPWECTCSLKVFYEKLIELETSSGLVLVDKENIRCSNMMDVPMFNLNSTAHWCKYSALFDVLYCTLHTEDHLVTLQEFVIVLTDTSHFFFFFFFFYFFG